MVSGDSPVFLEIQGFKEIFFHMFREGSKVRVEFGAEQVSKVIHHTLFCIFYLYYPCIDFLLYVFAKAIIVRDQAAKEKLLSEITSGLVLTIYEVRLIYQ